MNGAEFYRSYVHKLLNDIVYITTPIGGGPSYGYLYTTSGDSIWINGITEFISGSWGSTTPAYGVNELVTKHNDFYRINIASGASITAIDVNQARRLEKFELVQGNLTTAIDFTKNKALTYVYLNTCNLSNVGLDFSSNNLLTYINLQNNYINSLTLSNNPVLNRIMLNNNTSLASISLGNPNYNLNWFYSVGCAFPQAEVDEILKWFMDGGRVPKDLDQQLPHYITIKGASTGIPSATGLSYVQILVNRGWIVEVNSAATYPPTVTTVIPDMISSAAARSGGNVTSEGTSGVSVRGVCWSTSANPTTANSKTIDGSGSGVFSSAITDLSANTLYHVRAYATNSSGTSYGADFSFTTLVGHSLPSVSTNPVTSVEETEAVSGGVILSDGGAPIYEKGVCWNTVGSPGYSDSKTNNGTGSDPFTSNITGLTANTTYYVRAYARNRYDAGGFWVYALDYGTEYSFTTAAETGVVLPTVVTSIANTVTTTSAICGGNVTDQGTSNVVVKGILCRANQTPTFAQKDFMTQDGSGLGSYQSFLTGLTASTTYFYCAYAINANNEVAYGTVYVFDTTATARPTGLNNYTLFANITINGNNSNFYSTNALAKQACFDFNSKMERTVILGGYTDQAASLTVGQTVYAGVGTSTTVRGDGYYLIYSGLTISKIIYISGGVIQSITDALVVGDAFGGGLIGYILQPGDPNYTSGELNGIIVATSDQATSHLWWNGTYTTTGATGTALGTGISNTSAIIASQGNTGNHVAKLCADYSVTVGSQTFDDWYLPSSGEFASAICNLDSLGLGGFTSAAYYWTSTEVSQTTATAKRPNNTSTISGDKQNVGYARAVRYF